MAIFEIPLVPSRAQKTRVSLGGITYSIQLVWNKYLSTWVMDVSDVQGAPIVTGIPLVTGANLLEQFDYIGFPGALWVQTDRHPDETPTFDNLGVESHLYYVQ